MPHLARAMLGREQLLGADHQETLFTLYNIAAAQIAAGLESDALASSLDCYERNARVYGDPHPETTYAIELVAMSYELIAESGDADATINARRWRQRHADAGG